MVLAEPEPSRDQAQSKEIGDAKKTIYRQRFKNSIQNHCIQKPISKPICIVRTARAVRPLHSLLNLRSSTIYPPTPFCQGPPKGGVVSSFQAPYTWTFNTWFLGRPELVDVLGLSGSGGPNNHSKRWGASPPPLRMVVGAAGATQTHKISDFRPAPKTKY
jgi:hypothetical protein